LAEKVPAWIERLLLPRLSKLSGEIKGVNMVSTGVRRGSREWRR